MSLMVQSSATQAQQSGELVIHNGLIVNEDGRMQADVRIRGEKIVEIGPKTAMSWQRPNNGSRMNREVHVRFWERAEVQF
jgi:urease alpha subunit